LYQTFGRKALKNGFHFGDDGEKIKLMKGNIVILFDRCLKSKNGFVPGINMRPVLPDVGATVVDSIDVNNLQNILGHCGEAGARLTGKALGYETIVGFDTCEACSIPLRLWLSSTSLR
jgi:hypothetical protein